MSSNGELLTALEQSADARGRIAETPEDLAVRLGYDSTTALLKKLWTLQKLGLLAFKEVHYAGGTGMRDLRLRRSKRVSRAEILFELGVQTAAESAEEARRGKLRLASQLLDEAGELALAVHALDAVEHPQKELPHYFRTDIMPDAAFPGDGRLVRLLSPAEKAAVRW